ncbi:MAG: efflux RND transporter periplasmic adaptor subunit [Planctomycetota bacterium]|nr:efflux RND transporter periplasmic adaptor subunit [Planctomycetota bacterium]
MSKNSAGSITARAIISLALIAGLIYGGARAFQFLKSLKELPEQKKVVIPRTAVRVQPVELQDYTEVLSGYGVARALRKTQVEAELPGVVKWIAPKLEAGGEVVEGEVLVKLDDRDLVQARMAAMAGLEQAQASIETLTYELDGATRQLAVARRELQTAQREEERLRNLMEKERVTASAVDKQSLQTAIAEKAVVGLEMVERANRPSTDRALAEVSLRKSQLEKASNDLLRATILAPYAGVIEKRYVQLGARIAPGLPLFQIIDLSRVEIPVSLPASHFGKVQEGSSARFRYHKEDESIWEGKVARVAPSVNVADRTFHAYLDIQAGQNGHRIPEGAFVMADIAGPTHEKVIVVPRTAFVGEHLFVAERTNGTDNTAIVSVRYPTIRRLFADVALIDSGLKQGEEVILTNVEEIAEGSKVSIVREATPVADVDE